MSIYSAETCRLFCSSLLIFLKIHNLQIKSDPWCSTGSLSAEGSLIGVGGYFKGRRAVRIHRPCEDCDFEERSDLLGSDRWYNKLLQFLLVLVLLSLQLNFINVFPTGMLLSTFWKMVGLLLLEVENHSRMKSFPQIH